MVVIILLSGLSVLALVYLIALLRAARARGELTPKPEAVALGAVTNFFDTLGIGSFAPTTAYLKLRKMIPDSFLPAVLNAGHCLPSMAQALIFINLVKVDPLLLAACIVSAVAGATIGAPIVVRLPVRVVQAVVGVALLIAAGLYALTNLGLMPGGGAALSLPAGFFVLAVSAHFVMGALMTFGIGLFAPSLILLSLLGLDPKAAFPIMMGACAFLMPVSSLRFIKTPRIDLSVVLGLALGGVPAVLLAAFVVKSLPLAALRWGVVVVVLYAAALLIIAAARAAPSPEAALPPAA
ncbi:MAG TPA: permease [Caulobacteraceae bacterium]|nr:permease [Caulobacteraceae bacterium]